MRFLPGFFADEGGRLADFPTADNTTSSPNAVGTEEALTRDSDNLVTDGPLVTEAVGNSTSGETGSTDDVWKAIISRNNSFIYCKKSAIAIALAVPNRPIVDSTTAFTYPCTSRSNLASMDDQWDKRFAWTVYSPANTNQLCSANNTAWLPTPSPTNEKATTLDFSWAFFTLLDSKDTSYITYRIEAKALRLAPNTSVVSPVIAACWQRG